MNIKLNYEQIKELRIGEHGYPEKLQYIYAPPKVLYVIGNEQILSAPSISIIGCRECSEYGKKASYYFAQEFAKRKKIVISGFAKGIDTYAHKGTISVKERTIAVLGCGLDVIYPQENITLYKQILQNGGAIVTEYPLGSQPMKQHFPARNRIISGLSDGVLVIEARKRSGTLITVEHALDQGKDVYAVPRKYI